MGIIGASIIIGSAIIGCFISNGLDNIAGKIRDLAREINTRDKAFVGTKNKKDWGIH
jgi:hypothetical protein